MVYSYIQHARVSVRHRPYRTPGSVMDRGILTWNMCQIPKWTSIFGKRPLAAEKWGPNKRFLDLRSSFSARLFGSDRTCAKHYPVASIEEDSFRHILLFLRGYKFRHVLSIGHRGHVHSPKTFDLRICGYRTQPHHQVVVCVSRRPGAVWTPAYMRTRVHTCM